MEKFAIKTSKSTVDVTKIIIKWYHALDFPTEYNDEFYQALSTECILSTTNVEDYDEACDNGKKNLLSFLYMCEAYENQCKQKGIPESVILDTLQDVVIWTKIWSAIKGTLYLGELSWLKRHFTLRLFRLGRLQFSMAQAECDVEELGIEKGENNMQIHIPRGGKLNEDACKQSLARARTFFDTFFPDFSYRYFTCHSWLLWKGLDKYLPPESNILRFADMFSIANVDESDALLRYVFRWDTTRENIADAPCPSAFAQKVKQAVLYGEKFFVGYGVINKG
ncbi:MAG: DUF5596 domain-containing protein [Clostridia bacterium]|nr:DUF5596 domain-containing protein [Clostridia bacterium]